MAPQQPTVWVQMYQQAQNSGESPGEAKQAVFQRIATSKAK